MFGFKFQMNFRSQEFFLLVYDSQTKKTREKEKQLVVQI